MPVAAKELDGLRLYGWAFSAFMLANLVGITVAGPLADRRGPARPFAMGLTLFAIGLFVDGIAPNMPVLIVGRAIQGFGAGGLAAVAYVSVSRGYPERLRPPVMAAPSSAGGGPSPVGPPLAGLAGGHPSWRGGVFALLP